MKRYKVGINEDLISIFTYINTSPQYVLWSELLQHCIDYELYIELYMNIDIVSKLVDEHNKIVVQKNVQAKK